MIKLLYFFKLVDMLGCAQKELNFPAGARGVAGMLAWLGKRDEKYRAALADASKLQVTANNKVCGYGI